MNEIWKPIVGFEKLYTVSSLGKIRGTKILAPGDNGRGYFYVFLSKNGKEKRFYVHRLVAKTFLPNPENKPYVNHKNGIRNDNRVENLEWVTQSENELHKYKTLGYVQKNAKKVIQLKNGKEIASFVSIRDAQKNTGCDWKSINNCCKGLSKQTKGFEWKYKN